MSESTSVNNKRIARNTLLLYVRQLFTMAVSLYTSRIVLRTLGIEDFGVYNVVAGVVSMFSLFTGSLSAAISRYLTYNLGKGNRDILSTVFSTSLNIMFGMSIVVLIVAELLGVWFLNTHLNIPFERMNSANWVLQFSIITFIIGIISVPYNAAIIAHERMSVFAYISILEVILKLVIVYLLYISPIDKLITYSFLLTCVSLIIRFVYGFYCSHHFPESRYRFVYDKKLIKEMSSFAGWNFFGSGAYLFNSQGVNIITNLFFGVTINAARGVTNQVSGVIRQFVTNFTTSINPQITKSYAKGDLEYMFSLMCRSSKFCFFLMLFFAIPFIYEAECILKIWLDKYPPEAPLFIRLSLIGIMVDLLGNSPAIATWATGDIKRYYIYVSSVGCLVFPLSWLAFSLGFQSYIPYVLFIIVYTGVLFTKLYIVKGLLGFSISRYVKEVLFTVIYTTFVACILPSVLKMMLPEGILFSMIEIVVCILSSIITIYCIGLSTSERKTINTFALSKIKKII